MFVATFTLPHRAVALKQTFETIPNLEIEAERIAAHSTEWVMPCIWATNANFSAIDEAVRTDRTVDEIVEMAEYDDEKYYQVEWDDEVIRQIDSYINEAASILDAYADADGWRLRIRFASREQLDRFREFLNENDIQFSLLDLVEPGSPRQSFGEVTADQRNALVAAKASGYFRIPQETTLRELAEELDISHQTLSEHLRRGTANLIDATISTKGPPVR